MSQAPPQRPVLSRTKTADFFRKQVLEVIREATEVSSPCFSRTSRTPSCTSRQTTKRYEYASPDCDISIPEDSSDSECEHEKQDSSDEYDTDLEIDERNKTPYDRWGQRTYKRTCRKLSLRPIEMVVSGLKSQEVSVVGRGLNKHETLSICNALIDNMLVTHLNLEDNSVGDIGGEYVALLLQENDYITSLNLAKNNIGTVGLEAITNMLLTNENLTRLDISNNNLGDDDAVHIMKALDRNQRLAYLNMSHNNFGDVAGEILGPALADNEYLKTLDLSWNKIRAVGGVAIGEGLKDNVSLHTLNLAYNGFGVKGAFALAQALEINDTLLDLDLTCNGIFDEGGLRFAMMLDRNESLKYLRISNNSVTIATAQTILQVLKNNEFSSLELLDMSNLHVHQTILDAIVDIRDMRPRFRFKYGGVVTTHDGFGNEGDAINNRNPLTILKEYIAKKNMRLVDLFKMLDKDGGGSISKEEFVTGLQSIEVPLTEAQLDKLIKMLDTDGDGEVDYAELVSGDKEHRRKMRLKMEAAKQMAKMAKQKKKAKKAAEKAKAEEVARSFLEGVRIYQKNLDKIHGINEHPDDIEQTEDI